MCGKENRGVNHRGRVRVPWEARWSANHAAPHRIERFRAKRVRPHDDVQKRVGLELQKKPRAPASGNGNSPLPLLRSCLAPKARIHSSLGQRPRVLVSYEKPALKARFIRLIRAFGALWRFGSKSWGDAPGFQWGSAAGAKRLLLPPPFFKIEEVAHRLNIGAISNAQLLFPALQCRRRKIVPAKLRDEVIPD